MLILPSSLWASPQVQRKRNQLEEVKGEIEKIDARLETVIEDYNEARYKLSQTRSSLLKVKEELKENQRKLVQRREALSSRAREIYKNGELSVLEVVFKARELDEFIRSIKYASLLLHYDRKLLREIEELKKENEKKKRELEEKRKEEETLVARLLVKKKSIQDELQRRKKLYEEIKKEIASLEAAEARRQEELKRAYITSLNSQSLKNKRKAIAFRSSYKGSSYKGSYRVSRGTPRKDVVSIALAQLGKPYSWGAAGPNAFDCSGLVVYCFSQIGISLPHSSRALYNCGIPVSRNELQPGDLVFFARGGRINHVGIYVGNGNFIHAPHTGAVVRIQPLSSHGGYAGARRI